MARLLGCTVKSGWVTFQAANSFTFLDIWISRREFFSNGLHYGSIYQFLSKYYEVVFFFNIVNYNLIDQKKISIGTFDPELKEQCTKMVEEKEGGLNSWLQNIVKLTRDYLNSNSDMKVMLTNLDLRNEKKISWFVHVLPHFSLQFML